MVPHLKAENRLTPEDEFFCDLPAPTPRKHFIENIPTRLPEAGSSRRQGPWPEVCTVCRISACKGQRAQIPGRGEARLGARTAWGLRIPAGSAGSLGPGLGHRWARAVGICLGPGEAGRPQPGRPSARPTTPGGCSAKGTGL